MFWSVLEFREKKRTFAKVGRSMCRLDVFFFCSFVAHEVIFGPNSPFIHTLTLGCLPYKNLAPSCPQTPRRSRPPQTGSSRGAVTVSSDQRRAATTPLCWRPTRYSAAPARASLPSLFAVLWVCSFDAQIYWVSRLCVMSWADSCTGFLIKCCFRLRYLYLVSMYELGCSLQLICRAINYNRCVVLD
jgi:hypothetical protein